MGTQQAYADPNGELLTAPCLPKQSGFTATTAEHFVSLCQELSATILEQHSKALKRHGTVRMSFEFPYSGLDSVELTVCDDTLTIKRSSERKQNNFAS